MPGGWLSAAYRISCIGSSKWRKPSYGGGNGAVGRNQSAKEKLKPREMADKAISKAAEERKKAKIEAAKIIENQSIIWHRKQSTNENRNGGLGMAGGATPCVHRGASRISKRIGARAASACARQAGVKSASAGAGE